MEDRLRVHFRVLPNAPSLVALGWLVSTMLLWFLAFYRAPAATPEWLLRAQSACFGINESGLPNAGGWITLTLAPLSLILALIVMYPRELANGWQWLVAGVVGKLFSVGLVFVLVVEAGWVVRSINQGVAVITADYAPPSMGALPAHYPLLNTPASPFQLINQRGESVTLSALRGKAVVLTFAFAHCQTVCPVVVKNVRDTVHGFPADQVVSVVVTLDPWRDTPRSLEGLAKRWDFGANAHFLSGPVDDVVAVLDAYQVSWQRDLQTGDIVHPALVYIISPSGEIAYSFNNPSQQWLTEALTRLLGNS